MNNFPFRIQFERNKQNPRKIIYKSMKKNYFSDFASLNSSSSLPSIKIEDNRKKPFIFKSKLSELKKYQSKKTSDILGKNYVVLFTPEDISILKTQNREYHT